ncbi:prolipoprotein diacylglyceryl transferase [Cohaesibacter celericrescens]|uniref:Phosphatidylglycerol--prolipoprotein diacylglyceryl transferase n=1 Tax=Cohaesibacter celericrescens TaxID=2067669 RepID=A0A2N5XXB8_9HYPH|nr:prolipoprotein diacylglyceryl transferase [Cohaesibacter celericrescens]PLW79151.1 prolipoprotein diacylglyceryl transferase [Cohaesibacter celericrescens]
MTLLAIPFPVIDPVLLSLGPIQIHWYAIAYIVGILLAWFYTKRLANKASLWPKETSPMSAIALDDFVLWATLGIILGGRLGYVLFYNLDAYLANPSQIFAVWNGGMAFHGGFLGVTLAMILFAYKRSVPILSMFDLVAMAAPIGLLFGRIANFINSELWGRTTDMPWGIIFPNGGPEPRHPSQLYEAALEGLLMFILLRILSHSTLALKKPGTVAGTFAILYGIFRSLIELVRVPDVQLGYLSFGTTMGMWLSAPMVLAGILMILYAQRKSSGSVNS